MKRFLLLIAFVLIVFLLSAQKDVNIDTIVISTMTKPVSLYKEYKIVQVIEREQIRDINASSLSELLEKLTSYVDIKFRGGGEVQADLSINGSGFNDVLILVNGIRVNNYQTGHFSMNLPISSDMIERIEILSAPDAHKYGIGASAGVINIITGFVGNNRFSTKLGLYEQSNSPILAASFLTKDFHKNSGFIGLEVKQSNGYEENTDYNQFKFFLEQTNKIKNTRIFTQLGFFIQKFGALNFYTPKFPYQYEENNQQFASIVVRLPKTYNLKVSWQRTQDKFELFREGQGWYIFDGTYFIKDNDTAKFAPGVYYKSHNYHLYNDFDFALNKKIKTKFGETYLEMDLIYYEIKSTVLGDSLKRQFKIPFEKDKYFIYGAQRTNFIFGIDQIYATDLISISIGGKILYNRNFSFIPTGGMDISFKLMPNLKLFVGANHSMRLPSFTELYYNDPVHLANPYLKPEKSFAYQLGTKTYKKNIKFSQSIFYINYFNKIDWVFDEFEQIYYSQNFTSYNAYGINLNFKYKFNISFLSYFSFSYSYLGYKNFSYYQSKYSSNLLRQKANFIANIILYHRQDKKFEMLYMMSYKQRFKSVIVGDKRDFVLGDLIFKYRNSSFNLNFQIKNLFDIQWYDYFTPMPGRTYFVSVDLKF